jgi:hypothetical protein
MAADPTLPEGFTLDPSPAARASSSLPDGFQLDSAADMAADWRKRTGAGPDVPTPFDAGLPQSIPAKSLTDRAEDISSAAGVAGTAGLERSLGSANFLAGGLAGAIGMHGASDEAFKDAQAEAEDAARRDAAAAAQSKAGSVIGNVLGYVPQMMVGGESTIPGIIGGQQAVNTAQDVIDKGGTTGQAEKALGVGLPLDVAVNAIPGRVPLGSSALGQALSPVVGATAAAGGQAVSQEIQHQVSPTYVQAPNLSDASTQAGINLLGAVLGGHEAPEPQPEMDPFLRNYQEGAADRAANAPAPAPQTAALPAPIVEPPAQASPPAPAPTPTGPSVIAAAAFRQDPKTALGALDHPDLVQVAQDSGLDVKPTDSHQSIVAKLTALSPEDLEQHVLPEYLANLKASTSPEGAPSTPTPPAPSTLGQEPVARTIEPNVTVPVDASGTAYTPEQGSRTFSQALDAARGTPARLEAPVTTVDTEGNAVDSGAFNRAIQDAQAAGERKQQLGLTPDIERAQQMRAAGQPDELATQSDDDAPPWWLAGQDAEEQHNQVTPQQSEVPTQGGMRDSDAAYGTPDRHPWIDLDDSKNIPLAGGVDDTGNTVYVSKHMPDTVDVDGKQIDAKEGVFVHEVEEQKVMRPTGPKDNAYMAALRADIKAEGARVPEGILRKVQAGKPLEYPEAHHIATIRENAFIRQKYGIDPEKYQKALSDGITAAREGAKDEGGVPLDLDRRPYDDLDDEHLLPEVSNELDKLNIPQELHPQATQFLAHVEHALDAGVDPNALHEVARDTSDLPTKLAKINQLTQEAGGHALTSNTESEGVPRETSAAPLRETGEAGELAAQQGTSEADGSEHQAERQPAISHRSDELNDSGDGYRYITPPSERRADWTPQLEGRAITAIDHLVGRFQGSTLADSLNRDLKETQVAQLIGQKIEGPEDLAAMAAMVYRNPAFETFRYIGTDDAGNVLGEAAVSSRMPSTTKAFPTGTKDAVTWITSSLPEGTTKVWLMHNHPSGNPKASQADIDTTGSLAIKLGDASGAPKIAGHVILDHDTFGYIDASGDDQGVRPLGNPPSIDPTRYASGDVDMFAHKVDSPEFAAQTAHRIANATPKDHSAIVVMDAGRNVVSVHTFPNDFLMSPKGAATVSRLGQKSGAVGLGIVMDGKQFVDNRDAFNKAAQRGLFRNAYIVSPSGEMLDITGSKFLPGSVRKNFGQQSAATVQRSKAAVRAFENTPETNQPLVSLSAVKKALADRGMPQDQIDAMSREQLRAEQANLRRRSEPTPDEAKQGDTSSIKNAPKAEQRAWKGKDEVEYNVKRSDAEAYAQAKERMQRDPTYATRLTAELADANRPHSDVEAAVLNLDQARIKNDTAVAYEKLGDARAKGDEAEAASQLAQIKLLDGQMDANDLASRASGSEAGRALRARQVEINADYSIAALTKRARDAKGSDLTSAERDRLATLAKAIDEREKAVAAREQALQDQRRETRAPKERAAAKSKFDALADQLKAIAQKDHLKPGCVV